MHVVAETLLPGVGQHLGDRHKGGLAAAKRRRVKRGVHVDLVKDEVDALGPAPADDRGDLGRGMIAPVGLPGLHTTTARRLTGVTRAALARHAASRPAAVMAKPAAGSIGAATVATPARDAKSRTNP